MIESSPIEDPISEHVSGEDSEGPIRDEIEDVLEDDNADRSLKVPILDDIEDSSDDDNVDSTVDPPDPSLSQATGMLSAATSAQPQPGDVRAYTTGLCWCSGGQAKYEDVSKGVEILATDVQRLDIEARQPEDGLDFRTHISIVYAWLSAALKSSFNCVAQKSMPIAMELGSWFLCAHAKLPGRLELPWEDFMSAIRRCEKNLGKEEAFVEWVEAISYFPKFHRRVDQIANEYLQDLDTGGLGRLANLILDKEREFQTSTGMKSALRPELDDEESEQRLQCELFNILASMDEYLLRAIIQGRVFEQRTTLDHPVQKAFERLDSKKPQPSIYMNGIADRMGVSPAPHHWAEVCEHMRLYLENSPEGNRLAEAVDAVIDKQDTWSAARAQRGLRRYTDFSTSSFTAFPSVNKERREMVRYFISEMKSRIDGETQLGRYYVPFDAPVIEIGYSINPHGRLKEHRMHKSSNYIMNLADAVFAYLYPSLFPLQQAVIYPCFRSTQSWLAEVIFTQIGRGYVSGGRGFSHYAAGYSNHSAFSLVSDKIWERYACEADKDGELQKRVEQIAAEAKEDRRRTQQETQDTEEAELERLQCLF